MLVELDPGARLRSVEDLAGGINNRVAKLLLDDGRQMVVKIFDPHTNKHRKSFVRERDFLYLAPDAAGQSVARLLLASENEGALLTEYLPIDQRYKVEEIRSAFYQLCRFTRRLSVSPRLLDSQLNPAWEGGRTYRQHLETTKLKLERLAGDIDRSVYGSAARACDALSNRVAALGRPADQEDCSPVVVPSPSDVGLHNMARVGERGPVFFDFEFSGMDDLAKMFADFFLSSRVVPDRQILQYGFEMFCANTDAQVTRFWACFPLFCVRWACISLNLFTPQGIARASAYRRELDVTKEQTAVLESLDFYLDAMANVR